ncbi:MAG: hypothetical protein SF123_10905 [Chloroflexota bacterium]|nr:hypothetical protein [Chloroflexota bacterium]
MTAQPTAHLFHEDLVRLARLERDIEAVEATKRAFDAELKAVKAQRDALRAEIDQRAIESGEVHPHPLVTVAETSSLAYNPVEVLDTIRRELYNREAARDAFMTLIMDAVGDGIEAGALKTLPSATPVELVVGSTAYRVGDVGVLWRAYNAWHLDRDDDGNRLQELVRTKVELNAETLRKRIADDDNMDWAADMWRTVWRQTVRINALDSLTVNDVVPVPATEA